eukprot:Rhum_TRINITY_DN12942_c0_g1::Rhum_TRINITY_DN12942_c0_g1_i1::g.55551::m.55551
MSNELSPLPRRHIKVARFGEGLAACALGSPERRHGSSRRPSSSPGLRGPSAAPSTSLPSSRGTSLLQSRSPPRRCGGGGGGSVSEDDPTRRLQLITESMKRHFDHLHDQSTIRELSDRLSLLQSSREAETEAEPEAGKSGGIPEAASASALQAENAKLAAALSHSEEARAELTRRAAELLDAARRAGAEAAARAEECGRLRGEVRTLQAGLQARDQDDRLLEAKLEEALTSAEDGGVQVAALKADVVEAAEGRAAAEAAAEALREENGRLVARLAHAEGLIAAAAASASAATAAAETVHDSGVADAAEPPGSEVGGEGGGGVEEEGGDVSDGA